MPNKSHNYPYIILERSVVFPGETVPLVLEGDRIIKKIEEAAKGDRRLVLLFRRRLKAKEVSPIGVLVQAYQHWHLAPGVVTMTVAGEKRVKIDVEKLNQKGIAGDVDIRIIEEEVERTIELDALARSASNQFRKFVQMEGTLPLQIVNELLKDHISPARVCDIVASAIGLSYTQKLAVLETLDVKKRLEILNSYLARELRVIETEKKIQSEISKEIGKEQKELLLREQLKAIERELGISKEKEEYEDLEKKIKAAGLGKEYGETVLKELDRLKKMPVFAPEVSYIKTYLSWIVDLPWNKRTKDILNIKRAQKILDEDHYGLEKAKERVLEYLAVQKLTKGKSRGTIMCFAGPPGTGKTSVGKSIARALGRKFTRVSLGGIRDEAEIRGHRRTYVGALPGRIIQGIKNAATKNPVFMLDEIDKVGMDFRGDPSAALLEVLDPEQNNAFSDHYIEIPFDLSEVIFITTANILDTIPPALQDRMEVIEFPGYTMEEKFSIAKQYLLSRVFSANGLTKRRLELEDGAIKKIIEKYTREAGVRNLERSLSEIARKVARKIAEGRERKKIVIRDTDVPQYLGPEKFHLAMREEIDEVGVSTGLAWTPTGGEIIFIEVAIVPGQRNLVLTGQLGKVMQESAKAALSYVRSKSKELKFDKNFFQKSDIHIHVPSGAIAKDGPSAGIAIATALASALTKKKAKKEIAMTGEVTLRGKVLEIGGVKEKVLAAHRAGVEMIILPAENEKDLVDVPEEVRKKLKFRFAKHMDEVLGLALKNS